MADALKVLTADVPARGVSLAVEVCVQDIRPQNVASLPLESVALTGTLRSVGHDFLFQGRVHGEFVHPCDRCLEEAHVPFDVDVIWTYIPGAAELSQHREDQDEEAETFHEEEEAACVFGFDGLEIDLGPQVWEELVLAAPQKFVCDSQCQGLCASCGANLNTTPCACQQITQSEGEGNYGFAKLKDLFPGLSEP